MAATPDVSAAQATAAIRRQEFDKLAAERQLKPEVNEASKDEDSGNKEVAVEVEAEDDQEGDDDVASDASIEGESKTQRNHFVFYFGNFCNLTT